jgi:hypothetical protein
MQGVADCGLRIAGRKGFRGQEVAQSERFQICQAPAGTSQYRLARVQSSVVFSGCACVLIVQRWYYIVWVGELRLCSFWGCQPSCVVSVPLPHVGSEAGITAWTIDHW